jgi:cbb3-type cytochrome oxidase subunit 1
MRTILNTAHVYMILGLVSGLYYRELSKANDFTGDTQLSVVHTHLLTLGMLFFLIVLALEKLFDLTSHHLFGWFFWIYNTGLAITIATMTLHGTLTVLHRPSSEAIAMVAGLGHIVLTVGLILLFATVGKRIPAKPKPDSDPAPARPTDTTGLTTP